MKKVKLKEICEVDWGNTNLTKQAYVENGEFLGVSAGGCDGRMDYYDFEACTPVISAIGVNCGKMFLPSEPFVAIKNTITLKPRKEALGTYIYYALLDNHIPCRGGGQPFICKTDTEEYIIPCPSITEQIKIVDRLDKVSSLIEKRKTQLEKLDQLIKSRFIELFGDPIKNTMGWEIHRFDSLCENLDYRRKPITASEREAGIYPYYGASGIVDYVADYLFDEDILLVSEDGANLLMRSTPIAFSVSGKVWVNNHAHVVRFEKMSMQKYIEVFFSLIDISDHITGSAQPKLNQAKLNAMVFPVPSDDRLKAFLQFIEQTDKSKLAIQKSIDKLETLKKSLMQQYFG